NQIIPNKVNLKIDLPLTQLIEKELQQQLEIFSDSRIQNGAALVIENKTGNIISWVGNSNFENPNSGHVDGVTAKHQSGSSTKPFLYALALQKGINPTTIFADIPKDFGGANVYVPLNFDNRYNGPQRMRVALASSLNIPAVELLYNLGIDSYMEFLLDCGFDSLQGTREKTGLSLALGSNEITLLELVRAFSIFPNDGVLKEIQINQQTKKSNKQVIKTDTARIICDFLSDKAAQSLGFGNAKVFNTEYPSIFKTGTANQYQDIIALAATKEYTVGVWLGNLNGETVIKKTGSSIPALIARNILDYLTLPQLEQLDKKESLKFHQPEQYTKTQICTLSGCKPNQNCPSVSLEYVKNQHLKEFVNNECSWHIIKNGRLSINYPSEYQHWVSGQNMTGFSTNQLYTPIDFSYPTDGATFVFDKSIPKHVQVIRIQAYGGKINQAELFYDGKSQGLATNRFVWQIPLEEGFHSLEIICADETKKIDYLVQ
ncbi:MAG: penicillin-binding protein 1C, partial [Treponema sp.]|nr:penicillin-binding protein 1C [Treponema sp.]